MKARAHKRGAIVEEPVGHRRQQRKQDEIGFEIERRPGKRINACGQCEEERDGDEGRVERRAHHRLFVARALRVKARRRKTQPIIERRLHDHRDGEGEREAAVFLGAEKFRHREADDEIDDRIGQKCEKDVHLSVTPTPTLPRCAGEGVRLGSRQGTRAPPIACVPSPIRSRLSPTSESMRKSGTPDLRERGRDREGATGRRNVSLARITKRSSGRARQARATPARRAASRRDNQDPPSRDRNISTSGRI